VTLRLQRLNAAASLGGGVPPSDRAPRHVRHAGRCAAPEADYTAALQRTFGAAACESDIKIEVWMPYSGWNGRHVGTGNGVPRARGAGFATSEVQVSETKRRCIARRPLPGNFCWLLKRGPVIDNTKAALVNQQLSSIIIGDRVITVRLGVELTRREPQA
jgi:hypothetical protein